MNDKPIVTFDEIISWIWNFLHYLGVIASLLAVLWFLGWVK